MRLVPTFRTSPCDFAQSRLCRGNRDQGGGATSGFGSAQSQKSKSQIRLPRLSPTVSDRCHGHLASRTRTMSAVTCEALETKERPQTIVIVRVEIQAAGLYLVR